MGLLSDRAVGGPGAGGHEGGEGTATPALGIPVVKHQIGGLGRLGSPPALQVLQNGPAALRLAQALPAHGALPGDEARENAGPAGWGGVNGELQGGQVADAQAVEPPFPPERARIERQHLHHRAHRRALQQPQPFRRQARIEVNAQPHGRRDGHHRRRRPHHLAGSVGHADPTTSLLLDRPHRGPQPQRLPQLGGQQLRHLGGPPLHQPGLRGFVLGGHSLGPGQVKQGALMGLEATGAAHAREPGEGIASQFPRPLPLQPARDAQPIQRLGLRGGPGRPGGHPGHQLLKAPLQLQRGGHLIGRQTQLPRAEEQQARAEVVFDAGSVRGSIPVEQPLAVVMGGEAAQAELLQQSEQAVVGSAHPLAAQIQPQAQTTGVAPHPAAPVLPRLQQLYRQTLARQLPGADQAGKAGTHHHHINQRINRGIRHG